LLTGNQYLIAGIVSIYWSWQSGKYNERTWHITSAKTVAIIGFVIGCVSMNTVSRYISMIVFSIGTYAVNSIILGWVGATCGQTKEKRAVAMSIIVSTSNASFIWTPVRSPLLSVCSLALAQNQPKAKQKKTTEWNTN
jgi:hypothetical protein